MIEMPKFAAFYRQVQRLGFTMNRDVAFDVYANMLCHEGTGSWQSALERYAELGLDVRPQWAALPEESKPKDGIYTIYTDGACDNVRNKVGGAGYVILYDGKVVCQRCKGFVQTTNNRMELLAIASALSVLPRGADAVLYTDSQYCIQAIFSKHREAKKNPDLVALCRRMRCRLRSVDFRWVRGHDGDRYNEFADDLANTAYMEMCEHIGVRC